MSNKIKLTNYLNQYEFIYTIKETGQNVTFKPITTGQMKNLLVYEQEGMSVVEQVLDDIITGCVTTEKFDINALTAQDRFSLLVDIRRKSRGADYTFQIKCPKCGSMNHTGCNLDELKDIPFNPDIDKEVKLTDTLSLEFDYIRRSVQRRATDIVEARAKKEKMNDNQKLAEIVLLTYAMSITKFITSDGVFTQSDVELDEVVSMISSLDEKTYGKINDWFSDSTYGVDFTFELGCTDCDFKQKQEIPIAHFFG